MAALGEFSEVASWYLRWPAPLRTFLEVSVVALPIILTVAWLGGVLYRKIRIRLDRATEPWTSVQTELARQFSLPPQPDPEPSWFKPETARSWRIAMHQPAIALKDKYYDGVGRCVVLSLWVFILFSLNLTIFDSVAFFGRYVSAITFLSILCVFIFWWHARKAYKLWAIYRVFAELQRQWLQLTFIFSLPSSQTEEELETLSIKFKYYIEINSKVFGWHGFGVHKTDLIEEIHNCWDRWTKSVNPNNIDEYSPQKILFYTYNRMLNYFAWYKMRQEQLERAASPRDLFMWIMFFCALGLSIVDVVLTYWFSPDLKLFFIDPAEIARWLNFISLALVAASIGMGYLQNNKYFRFSLKRREMENQLGRTGELWLSKDFIGINHLILDFEENMKNDLVEWVEVISDGALEIPT